MNMLKPEELDLLLTADTDIKTCSGMLFNSVKTAIKNSDTEWLERLSYGIVENHLQTEGLRQSYENVLSSRDDIEKEVLDRLSAYYAECRNLENQLFEILKKRLTEAAPDLMKKALTEYGMAA